MIPPWIDALVQDVIRAAVVFGVAALAAVVTMLAEVARKDNGKRTGKGIHYPPRKETSWQ